MKRFLTLFALVLILGFGVSSVTRAQNTAPWFAEYFNNTLLIGPSVAATSVNSLNINWGTGRPAQGITSDFWSARFATNSFFNAGFYVFSILADDGFTLRVNNVIFADTFANPQPGKTISVVVPIQQGFNQIQVDFVQRGGVAFLFTNWVFQKPLTGGPGIQPPPPPVVVPTAVPPGTLVPSATSVTTQFGDFTPCIQRQSHQVNCFQSTGAWNAPDRGSIQLEPPILIWGRCTPGTVVQQQVRVGQRTETTQCSKTEAGFFIQPA